MKNLIGLLSGITFGVGLAISGMTDTQKVIGFLNLFGGWVPDLMFVMAGAVGVSAIGFYVIFNRRAPLCDTEFHISKKKTLDKQLIVGALIFGVGWALYGYCPGPAIASLAYLNPISIVFIIAMFTGMYASHILQTRTAEN